MRHALESEIITGHLPICVCFHSMPFPRSDRITWERTPGVALTAQHKLCALSEENLLSRDSGSWSGRQGSKDHLPRRALAGPALPPPALVAASAPWLGDAPLSLCLSSPAFSLQACLCPSSLRDRTASHRISVHPNPV